MIYTSDCIRFAWIISNSMIMIYTGNYERLAQTKVISNSMVMICISDFFRLAAIINICKLSLLKHFGCFNDKNVTILNKNSLVMGTSTVATLIKQC